MTDENDYPREGLNDRTDKPFDNSTVDRVLACMNDNNVKHPIGFVVIIMHPSEIEGEALYDVASNMPEGAIIDVLAQAGDRFKKVN